MTVLWSIELFENKRRAIELTASKSKRKKLESQSYRVLAVQFSIEALADALTQCEEETQKFKMRLVRGYNTDIHLDKQTWYWNGDMLLRGSLQIEPPAFQICAPVIHMNDVLHLG